jgi:formamidopyrimidine-DNA glycosylase
VGGRTSAVVPSVQKKTGPVAGDVKEEDGSSDEPEAKRKRTAPKKEAPSTKAKVAKKEGKQRIKAEDDEDEGKEKGSSSTRRRSTRNRK